MPLGFGSASVVSVCRFTRNANVGGAVLSSDEVELNKLSLVMSARSRRRGGGSGACRNDRRARGTGARSWMRGRRKDERRRRLPKSSRSLS